MIAAKSSVFVRVNVIMASQKKTFRLLKDREKTLARASDVANRIQDVREIERDFDALADEIVEPWNEGAAMIKNVQP